MVFLCDNEIENTVKSTTVKNVVSDIRSLNVTGDKLCLKMLATKAESGKKIV